MAPERLVHASPTKDFFISMITRDIALTDCILDLLDNSVDGARSHFSGKGAVSQASVDLAPAHVRIDFGADRFCIADNCGGISLNDAVDYAFHFGRRRDAGPSTEHGIGLYGIGMKRAIFKMGRTILVRSTTLSDAFQVPINVDEWAAKLDDWDFPLEPLEPAPDTGTVIEILDLYPGVSAELSDQSFATTLCEVIGRDYALLIKQGLKVSINGVVVQPMEMSFLTGGEFAPYQYSYSDESVSVEIVAGLSRVPPDEDSAGEADKPESKNYGWFVTCNDRVVLAGNKDDRTVWGYERFPRWHPQFYGFVGIVHFRAADPKLLPWTTTKRDIDDSSELFRRARIPMIEATRTYIDYTNARKDRLEEARRREAAVKPTAAKVEAGTKVDMKLPQFDEPKVKMTTVSYRVAIDAFEAVRKTMGKKALTRPEVGLRTFEFYRSRMVGEE